MQKESDHQRYIYFLLCCRHLGDTCYADASADAFTASVVYVVQPLACSLGGAYADENTMEAERVHGSGGHLIVESGVTHSLRKGGVQRIARPGGCVACRKPASAVANV